MVFNSDFLESVPCCPICGGEGAILYTNLPDRLIPGDRDTWTFQRCLNCGHVWLSPRLTRDNIIRAYSGYSDRHWAEDASMSSARWKLILKKAYFAAAYGYSDGFHWSNLVGFLVYLFPQLRERLDRQVRFLHAKQRGTLLDVGIGSGWFLQNMKWLGWQAEGVDIDPVSAKKASARNVPVSVGYLEEQHYSDNCFDAITMVHVIEHLHNPLEALSECYRILKHGGVLVIITPNVESRGHKKFGNSWQGLEVPRHLNLFNANSLKSALKKANYKIERITTLPSGTESTWRKSLAIKKNGNYQVEQQTDLKMALLARYWAMHARVARLIGHAGNGEELLAICRKVDLVKT